MVELVELAKEIQAFLESRKWPFCFIGGFALQRWGEQRFTRDVDLTLLTGFGQEELFIDAFLAFYKPRQNVARSFALENRVLLLESDEGIPFDIALGGIPFEQDLIQRSSFFEYRKGVLLRTCSAEDLIVMKAFADRDIDWMDIKGIVIRQQNSLDWDYIIRQLTPLCQLKEHPEIVSKLDALKKKASA